MSTATRGSSRPVAARRRRWPRVLLWTVVILAILFYGAGGWYFSDQLRSDGFEVKPHQREFRAIVDAVGTDTITMVQGDPADGELFNAGLMGLVWEGGYGTVEEIVDQSETTATRQFVHLGGDPPSAGTRVDVDPWVYPDDFAAATELPFEPVSYQSPLGPMEAVLLRGTSGTWAVLVHGKNATPREDVRMAETLWESGMSVLAITHRNDEGQPGDASGIHQYGATEWEDLEGAIDFARSEGAEQLVLGGLSTGAAVVMSFLERSDRADGTVGLVFDSPNIDFGTTVNHNAARRKLPVVGLPVPSSLTWVAKMIGTLRWGVDWDEINYVSRAEGLEVPVLILHGTDDPSVPIETSRQLASLRPDLVTLVEFEGAKHVQSWNVDQQKYADALNAFVADLPA
jgi:uncharacterized protein